MENSLKWNDKARVYMIEKSEFYTDSQCYQYGFYDGYNKAIKDITEKTFVFTTYNRGGEFYKRLN